MEYLASRRARIEERLETVLDGVEPPELAEEVRHVSLSGGKRVRPLVTLLVCEAAGGRPVPAVDSDGAVERRTGDGAESLADGVGGGTRSPAEATALAVEFAVGVELVHNASLVVDDIIDESELRRGVESLWVAYGHGPALIASDGLLGEAFSLFAADSRALTAVAEAMVELGEGEATELVSRPTTEAEYMDLARRKTGALFRAAAELGAIAAASGPHTVEAFGDYAERVGVAFQIRDDVLDATADAADLGKPTGQDAEMERPSLVRVTELAPAEANERARAEADAALDALVAADVEDTEALGYLRDLAEFVVERER